MTREEKRAEWAGVLELWRESGLGKSAFCREYELKPWQFQYWCRRLDAEAVSPEAGDAEESASFVPLRFSDEVDGDAKSCGLTLVLRWHAGAVRGARLELAADFDEAALARVLRVLGTIPDGPGGVAC